jgi:hypothetical protein
MRIPRVRSAAFLVCSLRCTEESNDKSIKRLTYLRPKSRQYARGIMQANLEVEAADTLTEAHKTMAVRTLRVVT